MNDETTTTDVNEDQARDAEAPPATDQLTLLTAEMEELRQKLLYAQAETQNVRRRLEKDKADAQAYAATGFARDMLSVADNMARALAAIPEDVRADEALKPLVTGIEMVAKELETVLGRNGVQRIEALGQPLDPNRHQAILEVESEDAEPGTIVQELQAGYVLKDRLLRPAMVSVAKR